MTFNSLVFLCIFLPLVFLMHSLIPVLRVRNALLILARLIFYTYGEPVYILLLLGSVLLNYVCVLFMTGKTGSRKGILVLAVLLNLSALVFFKYAGFFVESINNVSGLHIPAPEIHLPIGISFFTFQAMSYVIDVYRGEAEADRNPFRVLLYISFFPQLIAGPIVRFRDIAAELRDRRLNIDEAAQGLRRFLFGLAKKVLIANTLAESVDTIFAAGPDRINILTAWIGAAAFMLQIYFDFSGYSDMAIGMGRMFGFHFRENFDFPYVATSIKEFWRRWHISLSTWFREYVYIPLGGNRKGKVRTGLNKLLVFFLCGLWHGARWTYVLWGMFHGAFSFLEEAIPRLRKLPRVLGHIYAMLVVTVGFVIFRAESVKEAFGMLGRMFAGFDLGAATMSFTLQQLTPLFICALVVGILLAGPAERLVKRVRNAEGPVESALKKSTESAEFGKTNSTQTFVKKIEGSKRETMVQMLLYLLAFLLLLWCLLRLSGGTYEPFIYFRF